MAIRVGLPNRCQDCNCDENGRKSKNATQVDELDEETNSGLHHIQKVSFVCWTEAKSAVSDCPFSQKFEKEDAFLATLRVCGDFVVSHETKRSGHIRRTDETERYCLSVSVNFRHEIWGAHTQQCSTLTMLHDLGRHVALRPLSISLLYLVQFFVNMLLLGLLLLYLRHEFDRALIAHSISGSAFNLSILQSSCSTSFVVISSSIFFSNVMCFFKGMN